MKHVVGVKYKSRENGIFVSERRGIEKEYAEKNGIPHETVLNIVLNEEGKILRIMRSSSNSTYPDYNSVPAGHVDCDEDKYEKFKTLIPESSDEAALRELEEETGFKPISYKRFNDKVVDGKHLGYVYVMCVKGDKATFNYEIDPKNSGFETPERYIEKVEE